MPHIDALADHTAPATDTIPLLILLRWTARFIQEQGAVSRAIALSERTLAGCERVLGDDHPDHQGGTRQSRSGPPNDKLVEKATFPETLTTRADPVRNPRPNIALRAARD